MTTALTRRHVPSHPASQRERYERIVRAAGAQSRFVSRPSGARVHVIVAGDGPPVVHLHGNNTSALSHVMLLEHLTTVTSYLVDRPGFGLSDPDDFPRKSFRSCMVRCVDEILDALELESAVLVGASGGGVAATWYALDRPERTRGLVMLGSVPTLPGSRIPLAMRLMAAPGLGDVLGRAVRPGRRMILRLMSSMGERETILRYPDLLESLVDAARDPVATAANVAELRAVLSPLGTRPATRIRPEDLHRLAVPTLMVWGDLDPIVPLAAAKAAAMLIPHARLEVLPAGHVPQLGNPKRVAELLDQFARQSRPAEPRGCGLRARGR